MRSLIVCLLLTAGQLQLAAQEEEFILKGRVLAVIDELGFGPRLTQLFIFGMEFRDNHAEATIIPVLISYEYMESEGPLPEDFFDYSKLYELRVNRQAVFDTTLESISYLKFSGPKLPDPLPPILILRTLPGAPKDLLKMDMLLNYYELYPGDFKVIGITKKNGNRG